MLPKWTRPPGTSHCGKVTSFTAGGTRNKVTIGIDLAKQSFNSTERVLEEAGA